MNTNTKSAWNYIVSQNHIIPSPLANRLGVPVFRTLIADMLIRFRRFKNCRPKDDFENQLIKKGIVVIPNFLRMKIVLLHLFLVLRLLLILPQMYYM